MKTINFKSTLYYYDGPQVIEGEDAIGGHYVGVLVEAEEDVEKYLVVGVSGQRLRRFKVGSLDLRALFLYLDEPFWFLGDILPGGRIELEQQAGELAKTDFLPGEGFFLYSTPSENEVALNEARSRRNLCFEISIEPREASQEHKVRSKTLTGLLGHWQAFVKHAYEKAYSLKGRRSKPDADQYAFDVIVPAAPGSFRIVMEAALAPDLFATGDLFQAFEVIDRLFDDVEDSEKAAATVREFKGHLAGAYLRLLRFLSKHDTGLKYSWALPDFPSPVSRAIARTEATPIIRLLEKSKSLTVEETEIVGTLKLGSDDGKTWRLVGDDQKEYRGSVKKGGPPLDATLGQRYAFRIREEIESTDMEGEETIRRFLLSYRPA